MLTAQNATPTLIEQHARLITELRQVMDRHPYAVPFRLLVAPDDLDLATDEVLVQTVHPDRGVLELQPRKISDLTPTDTLHTTQIVDPAETTLSEHTSSRTHPYQCVTDRNSNGERRHMYVG